MGFHENLRDKGIGAKDWINSFTEVEYLGKGKFGSSIATGNRVFKDKTDNKWKKHKLTDDRPVKDYVLVQSAKCCVEVYPYYAKYFDVNHEEVRLYEERWVVQRLFKEPDTWRDVDAYNPVITVEEYPEPAGDVVKVTVTYDSDYGILTVEYFQRDGNALKHNVTFKNTSGSEETFRVLQRWAGIVGNNVDARGKNHTITGKNVIPSFDFKFKRNDGSLAIGENLCGLSPEGDVDLVFEMLKWEQHGVCNGCGACCHAYNCQYYDPDIPDKCEIHIDKMVQQWKHDEETFSEWYMRRDQRCPSCFNPVSERHMEGWEGCAFSFTEREITENDRIPWTILYPVAVDVHPSGMKCDFVYGLWVLSSEESLVIDPDTYSNNDPAEDGDVDSDGTKDTTATLILFGKTGAKPLQHRGYVEWDVSGIPVGSTITDTVFKYEGQYNNSDGHIHAMANRPSVTAGGAVYTDAGDGTEYVNPDGFPVDVANQSVDLGTTADSDLQGQLGVGWFAIGLQNDTEAAGNIAQIKSENYTDAPTPKPTLYVEYEEVAPPPTFVSPNMIKKAIIR